MRPLFDATLAAPAFARFAAAFGELTAVLEGASRRIAVALSSIGRFGRAYQISSYGPGNEDADGIWLTDMCAAWVHGSCPSSLCDCRCHR